MPVTWPLKVRETAFALFLENKGVDEIAAAMSRGKRRGPKAKTIERWIGKHHWVERRQEVLVKAQTTADAKRSTLVAEILPELRRIREAIVTGLGNVDVKSVGEGVAALSRVLDRELQLEGLLPTKGGLIVNVDARKMVVIVGKVLDALAQHPAIGPVLELHRTEVLQQLTDSIEKMADGATALPAT